MWDIINSYPYGLWGIALTLTTFAAGWQLAGWYKSRNN
jgi:hypothetical protein